MAEASNYKVAVDGDVPLYFDNWEAALREYVRLARDRREPTLYMSDWSMVSIPANMVAESDRLAKEGVA